MCTTSWSLYPFNTCHVIKDHHSPKGYKMYGACVTLLECVLRISISVKWPKWAKKIHVLQSAKFRIVGCLSSIAKLRSVKITPLVMFNSMFLTLLWPHLYTTHLSSTYSVPQNAGTPPVNKAHQCRQVVSPFWLLPAPILNPTSTSAGFLVPPSQSNLILHSFQYSAHLWILHFPGIRSP